MTPTVDAVVDSFGHRTRAANDKRLADLETVETRVNVDGVRAKRGQQQHVEAVQNACRGRSKEKGDDKTKSQEANSGGKRDANATDRSKPCQNHIVKQCALRTEINAAAEPLSQRLRHDNGRRTGIGQQQRQRGDRRKQQLVAPTAE